MDPYNPALAGQKVLFNLFRVSLQGLLAGPSTQSPGDTSHMAMQYALAARKVLYAKFEEEYVADDA